MKFSGSSIAVLFTPFPKLNIISNINNEIVISYDKEKIKIHSFGTFQVVNKKERVGRNPKTKIEAKITARKIVKFKPSQKIKEKINKHDF